MGEAANVQILRADPTRPPRAAQPCALVFLDPPYRSGLGPPALAALAAAGWIAPDAIACLEVAAREDCAPPDGFTLLDERRYGAAKLLLLRRTA